MCGVASRRSAEELIKNGHIKINNGIAKIGDKIDPAKDKVYFNGKQVKPVEKYIYIALNKPAGYISSCSSAQGASILDIVKIKEKVFPVGRLDRDSEGLMLLTNDGELANKLSHPKFGCEKEYEIEIEKPIEESELDKLRKGIWLIEGKTKPCKILRTGKKQFKITLKEGKKRQIKRIFQEVGGHVTKLVRIRIKNIFLDNLKPGDIRYLSDKEIEELKKDSI